MLPHILMMPQKIIDKGEKSDLHLEGEKGDDIRIIFSKNYSDPNRFNKNKKIIQFIANPNEEYFFWPKDNFIINDDPIIQIFGFSEAPILSCSSQYCLAFVLYNDDDFKILPEHQISDIYNKIDLEQNIILDYLIVVRSLQEKIFNFTRHHQHVWKHLGSLAR